MGLAHQMKVSRGISCLGTTRIDGEDRKKQADRAWSPIRQGHQFPTLALEVGYSQTLYMIHPGERVRPKRLSMYHSEFIYVANLCKSSRSYECTYLCLIPAT